MEFLVRPEGVYVNDDGPINTNDLVKFLEQARISVLHHPNVEIMYDFDDDDVSTDGMEVA